MIWVSNWNNFGVSSLKTSKPRKGHWRKKRCHDEAIYLMKIPSVAKQCFIRCSAENINWHFELFVRTRRSENSAVFGEFSWGSLFVYYFVSFNLTREPNKKKNIARKSTCLIIMLSNSLILVRMFAFHSSHRTHSNWRQTYCCHRWCHLSFAFSILFWIQHLALYACPKRKAYVASVQNVLVRIFRP